MICGVGSSAGPSGVSSSGSASTGASASPSLVPSPVVPSPLRSPSGAGDSSAGASVVVVVASDSGAWVVGMLTRGSSDRSVSDGGGDELIVTRPCSTASDRALVHVDARSDKRSTSGAISCWVTTNSTGASVAASDRSASAGSTSAGASCTCSVSAAAVSTPSAEPAALRTKKGTASAATRPASTARQRSFTLGVFRTPVPLLANMYVHRKGRPLRATQNARQRVTTLQPERKSSVTLRAKLSAAPRGSLRQIVERAGPRNRGLGDSLG